MSQDDQGRAIAAKERQQVSQFLSQSTGKLAVPVAIYTLEDSGFFLTSNASTNGAVLARDVVSDNEAEAFFLAPHAQRPFKGTPIDSSLERFPPLAELRALGTIAIREVVQPGRKLLLWIGPSRSDFGTAAIASSGKWALLRPDSGPPPGYSTFGKNSADVKRDLFQKICWLSALLRQARITLNCFSIGEDQPVSEIRLQLLAGVPSPEQASWMSPLKEILAVQSGGQILSSWKNLVEQMNDSIQKARVSYSLTYDPPLAAHADEYHSLKVQLNKPGLTAHTSAGYYDQPFYSDPPDPTVQHVTVAQLEEMLQATRSSKSLGENLSGIVLSQRLSHAKLQPLLAKLHQKKLRDSLEMIADKSTFLDPPSAGSSDAPPPKRSEQQRILTAALSYLNRVLPTLPDLFATRTAVHYREAVAYPGLNSTAVSVPLHAELQSKETVLYRQHKEVLSGAGERIGLDDETLRTYGTFGPILGTLQAVLQTPNDITWGWWESDAGGKHAVFRYRMVGTPTLTLSGCCYPNGGKDARIEFSSGSHGELVIDPETGAILRVQTESDMPGFVPTKRSEMMVSYGPVEIGGRTYIVPLRSVNIWRARSVATLAQWNVDFATWGPYETQMNVFTFGQYHLFRGDARILPGFTPTPQ